MADYLIKRVLAAVLVALVLFIVRKFTDRG